MSHRAFNTPLHVHIAVATAHVTISVTGGAEADSPAPTSGDDSKNGVVMESPKSADGAPTSGPLASSTGSLVEQVDGDLT